MGILEGKGYLVKSNFQQRFPKVYIAGPDVFVRIGLSSPRMSASCADPKIFSRCFLSLSILTHALQEFLD